MTFGSLIRSIYGPSRGNVTHVISPPRPSHFSACNIEKLGMGLGTRLVHSVLER